MIKTLLAQVRQYKKDALLAPLFTALEVLMEVLIPFVTAAIIDQGIQAGNMGQVYRYGLLMLALALFSLCFGVLAGRFSARASAGYACNLRDAMYCNVQTFSFSNIDKFSTAGLVTRMTTDVTNLQNAFQMILRIAVRAPLMLVCSMFMCFFINVRLSLIFLAAIVVLAAALVFIMLRTTRIFDQVFRKYDDLNASVQENVSAIRVVKAFVRETFENEKFKKAADNLYRLFVKAEGLLALNNPVMMLVVYGCILGLSWFGAHFIVAGALTTGELTSLLSYVMSVLMSLMMLSMVFVMISMSTASAERIAEVLTETPDLAQPAKADAVIPNGSIDFDHVSFSYKHGSGEKTLHDITLHINSGETVGIIGGTGSGKSSLVNLVSRLYDADTGRICVGGKDVRSYDLETLRSQVAVVLQKNVLFYRHHPGQPALGQGGRHRGGMPRSLPRRLRRRVHRPLPRRVQHLDRAGRHQRVRRAEAAAVHCACAAETAQGPDFGRLHQRGGHRHRRQDPPGLCRAYPRHHQADHCPARFQRAGRRPHPGFGQRRRQRL